MAQRIAARGKSGSALYMDRPVASMVAVIAIAAMTPATGQVSFDIWMNNGREGRLVNKARGCDRMTSLPL